VEQKPCPYSGHPSQEGFNTPRLPAAGTPLKRGFSQCFYFQLKSPLKRGETGVCKFFAFVAVPESRGLNISQRQLYIGQYRTVLKILDAFRWFLDPFKELNKESLSKGEDKKNEEQAEIHIQT
jgi:hypothetical protein